MVGTSVDPRSFTQSLAAQLATASGNFADAALGNLPASYQVKQHVGVNNGQLVGIHTQNLWIKGTSTADGFSAAVKEPLRALYETHPAERFAIMVDGLDEARQPGPTSIIELLAGMSDLPDNVKILITTRQDHHITRYFEFGPGAVATLDLSAKEFDQKHGADIARYVAGRAATQMPAGVSRGQRNEILVSNVTQAADCNFQYAQHLMDELSGGLRSFDQQLHLPQGLPALYRSYLERIVPADGNQGSRKNWLDSYRPLIEVIGIAVAPIPATLVAKTAGMEASDVQNHLDDLQQILRFSIEGEDSSVSFFHASMADFLGQRNLDDGRPNPYFIDWTERQLRFVKSCLGLRKDWRQAEGYVLAWLPDHMARCVAAELMDARQLLGLVSDPSFRAAQHGRFGTSDMTARSCQLAVDIGIQNQRTRQVGDLLRGLAESSDPVLSGTAVAGIVQLYNASSRDGKAVLKDLMRSQSQSGKLSALNVAYRIPGETDVIFRWAAVAGNKDLVQVTAYALYLRWLKGQREEVARLLLSLAESIAFVRPLYTRRAMIFLAQASIELYISLCHDAEVAELVNRIWSDLVRTRMHVGIFSALRIDRLLTSTPVAGTLASRIADEAMFGDLQSPRQFFAASPQDRKLFNDSIELILPGARLEAHLSEIKRLLESDIVLFRILGSMIVSANCCTRFDALEPDLRRLAGELTPRGRLWLLFSFSVIFPDTPDGWYSFALRETEWLINEGREVFISNDGGVLRNFNVALLPLALTAGKVGAGFSLIDDRLRQAMATEDSQLATEIIQCLGFVGFYEPGMALAALRAVGEHLEGGNGYEEQFIRALGSISVVYPESAELYLNEIGRRDLSSRVLNFAEVDQARKNFERIGFFNNAVNQAYRYPNMREMLLVPSLTIMGNSSSKRQYVQAYARMTFDMLIKHNYQLGILLERS